MLVTVYTKPACPNCVKTKRHLEKNGIEYTEAPIIPEVMDFATERGFKQAPIVTVYRAGDTISTAEAWCGYQPHKIDALDQE